MVAATPGPRSTDRIVVALLITDPGNYALSFIIATLAVEVGGCTTAAHADAASTQFAR